MALGELEENILDVTERSSDADVANALHRIGAEESNDVTGGARETLELVEASPPNVFSKMGSQQNQNEANLMANSQASNGAALNFSGTATAQRMGSEAQKTEKAEKDRKSFQEQAFQSLLQRIRDLDKQIAWHGQEIDRLVRQRDAIDRAMAKIHRGEKPELNPDGTFKDQALEQAARDYEKRTGKKIDRNNPDLGELEQARADHESQISGHKRDQDRLEVERAENEGRLREMDPEQAAKEFGETYEAQGRDAAEAALAHAENDEVQQAVVNAQGFDDTTEENAIAVANQGADALFGESNGDASGFQLGTRTQGELTGEFASLDHSRPEAPADQPDQKPESDKPFTLSQQLNG